MAYQVLARKWRPQNFTQLVGQEHVSQTLSNALQRDRLHHAYLFTGTRGVGKTTIARILAKAINCENLQDANPCGDCHVCLAFEEGRFLDLIEVDAASRTKVEDTRDLLDNVQYAPHQGQYKVYLIDEVHMLSGHSFNALLKTLEEPPPHVKFLFATTDQQKIPITILSRCLQFNLKRLTPDQIEGQMAFILQKESIKFDTTALKLLSRAADGSLRDGLSLLDQAISFGSGEVELDIVSTMLGTVAQQVVDDILLALANNNAPKLLQKIADIAQLTPDFVAILQQILAVLHRVTIVQTVSDFVDNVNADTVTQLADKLTTEDVHLFYQIALLGQSDLDLAPDLRSGFEMIMLRMITFRADNGVSAMQETSTTQTVGCTADNEVSTQNQDSVTPQKNKPSAQQTHIQKPITDTDTTQTNTATQDWSNVVAKMQLQGLALQLASHCALQSVDEKTCHLLLYSRHAQLKTTRTTVKLQKSLCDYFARPLTLEIEIKEHKKTTPAKKIIQKNQKEQQEYVDSINADENIKALKEHFDARIIKD